MTHSKTFNFSQSLKLVALTASILGLISCGSAPLKQASKPQPKPVQEQVVEVNAVEKKTLSPVEAIDAEGLAIEQLKQLRSEAAAQQNWDNYFYYSAQLWQQLQLSPVEQAEIETQAWTILGSLSTEQLDYLAASDKTETQSWLALHNAMQLYRLEFEIAVLNLQNFESDAIYQKHLLPQLLNQRQQLNMQQQIAVLLPFNSKYGVISNQIRDGIIKAFFASKQTATLRFYDSSDLATIQDIYQQAKDDGATHIIGPLRKEALLELAGYQDEHLVALNDIDEPGFIQFSFKSAEPTEQMMAKLNAADYQRIGIISNDKQKILIKAHALLSSWKAEQKNADLNIYPDGKPRLRQALGNLIHEQHSKARKNNLRWMLGKELHFFPRLREDLDAIVIFDNAQRMAVFRPQFDFFEIDMPILGSTALTPKDFQDTAAKNDLKNVRFLTYPASLSPEDLTGKFEAFGWDSFQISNYLSELRDDAYIANGKTGVLTLENNKINQSFVWAQYNSKGNLMSATPLPVKYKTVLGMLFDEERQPHLRGVLPKCEPEAAEANLEVAEPQTENNLLTPAVTSPIGENLAP